MPQSPFTSNVGSLAMLFAMRRASSSVSTLSHVSVVRVLPRIDIREGLTVGVPPGIFSTDQGRGNRRSVIAQYYTRDGRLEATPAAYPECRNPGAAGRQWGGG
jgi:hypothetical protein